MQLNIHTTNPPTVFGKKAPFNIAESKKKSNSYEKMQQVSGNSSPCYFKGTQA
jgi:hypothetical protein